MERMNRLEPDRGDQEHQRWVQRCTERRWGGGRGGRASISGETWVRMLRGRKDQRTSGK